MSCKLEKPLNKPLTPGAPGGLKHQQQYVGKN